MSRICEICQKGYQKANLVPRGIGKRVTRRTIKTQRPNLRTKKLNLNGQKITVSICTSCLKRMKFEERKLARESLPQTSA